ncbi:MAG: NADH-quinone oxidoreductase subunit J [Anaerolineales bacterium]|nr:NADH-quinone oxidoreductase subunit J [Anaerolineales bacterium]
MAVDFELIMFFILAGVGIGTAAGMLLSRSAVYSALFLVLNFGAVAGFYLFLNAPFIAMAQITVYAGAIMVLFLFVIMLLGAEKLTPPEVLPWQRPLAVVLAGILILEAAYLLFLRTPGLGEIQMPGFGPDTSPAAIGAILFGKYLLPFEITSVLLLTAMVGAIVLVRPRKQGGGQE